MYALKSRIRPKKVNDSMRSDLFTVLFSGNSRLLNNAEQARQPAGPKQQNKPQQELHHGNDQPDFELDRYLLVIV